MNDSLSQHMMSLGGIPDWGTRIAAIVVIAFILIILILLLYGKMVEVDEKLEE